MTTKAFEADDHSRIVWIITGIAAVVFWLVCTSGRPWDLFAEAGFSADFYDEQARVLLRGRLAVDPAVAGPEGFVIGDSTYLYYGPFLALVRMPFMLFGDVFVGRLVRISMLIALVVLCRWSYRLSRRARVVVRPHAGGKWPTAIFVGAVAFSPALFAAGWVSVYNETELWALTLAVITVTLAVEWAASNFTDRRSLLLAAAAALATTLTRVPIGLGVALGLGVCGLVLLVRSRSVERFRRPAVVAMIAGVVPLVAHAVVNYAKFGSWLSVPGDRQVLTLTSPARDAWFEGTGGSFFSPRFLPTTLAQYWRPDAVRLERLLPGVRFGPLAPDYGGYPVESSTPASSLTTTALLLLILAVAGVIWLLRRRALTWSLVVAATAVGAAPTFLIGFIANRYLIDMLPPLITAGAVGIWVLADMPRQRMLHVGAAVLAAWGLWANASLAIWNLELKSPGFTEARYEIDDAVFGSLFGSSPPGLVILDPTAAVPRDGVVALEPTCAGVYIAEQGGWYALERAIGGRSTRGTIGEQHVLAETSVWRLAADSRADGTVDIVLGDRLITTAASSLEYEVVVDPITSEFFIRLGDEVEFLPGDVVGGVDEPISPDPAGTIGASPLCTSLTTMHQG